jgi:GDP-L-fucose synthase
MSYPNLNSKKILITGGTGLLGSNFPYKLKPNSQELDLLNLDQTLNYFNTIKPDVVFHCAAVVGGIVFNETHPVDILNKNIVMDSNLLKACHESQVKCLITYASTCAFPDQQTQPYTEKDIFQGTPFSGHLWYGYAKRVLYSNILAYRKQYSSPFYCLAPCNLYGPNDNFGLKSSHVVAALIRKAVESKNGILTVWGDGTAKRELLYVKDLVKLSMLYAETFFTDEETLPPLMIVSSDKEVSIQQIAEEIAKKKGLTIVNDLTKPNGQKSKTSSTTLLKTVFPSFFTTPLSVGLEDTINWFELNYSTFRGKNE